MKYDTKISLLKDKQIDKVYAVEANPEFRNGLLRSAFGDKDRYEVYCVNCGLDYDYAFNRNGDTEEEKSMYDIVYTFLFDRWDAGFLRDSSLYDMGIISYTLDPIKTRNYFIKASHNSFGQPTWSTPGPDNQLMIGRVHSWLDHYRPNWLNDQLASNRLSVNYIVTNDICTTSEMPKVSLRGNLLLNFPLINQD